MESEQQRRQEKRRPRMRATRRGRVIEPEAVVALAYGVPNLDRALTSSPRTSTEPTTHGGIHCT